MNHFDWKLFDWNWKYCACNKNGSVYLYEHKPYMDVEGGKWMVRKGKSINIGLDLAAAEKWEQTLSGRSASWHEYKKGIK